MKVHILHICTLFFKEEIIIVTSAGVSNLVINLKRSKEIIQKNLSKQNQEYTNIRIHSALNLFIYSEI